MKPTNWNGNRYFIYFLSFGSWRCLSFKVNTMGDALDCFVDMGHELERVISIDTVSCKRG